METLTRRERFDAPVRVVQFGEGNFLRAFIDWMFDLLNEKTSFRGAVQMVQPLKQGMADAINAQDGLYTLILRGMSEGKVSDERRVIRCVKGCLNAYTEWEKLKELFRTPELRFSFSNTTEAGIEYRPEKYSAEKTPDTFPAKVTALLYERFRAKQPGMIFLPCELIDRNGATLRECILKYAADWSLPESFAVYVEKDCVFCSTLVDRIVAGYPRGEAEKIWTELGYRDNLLDCGEPFHFFVIEGPDSVAAELPFREAGINAVFVKDQTPYRTRKVRFLNGAHTASVLAAYLAGFDYVDEMVADPFFSKYLKQLLFDEIYPTVPLPDAEKTAFANAILERFANPFAMHRLLSISLNSVSKWKVRVLPSLLDHLRLTGKLPALMTFSLAALLAFYRNEKGAGKSRVNAYPVADNPAIVTYFETLWRDRGNDIPSLVRDVLARVDFWEMDLTSLPGFADAVAAYLSGILADGVRLTAAKAVAP